MRKLRHNSTQTKLEAVGFEQRAQQVGLDNAYTKKIRTYDLLMGFFLMYNKGHNSLESLATCIEQFTGQVVSKQAVALKFEERHLTFFKDLCVALINSDQAPPLQNQLFDAFERVLIEDSTCCALHASLAEDFPSSGEAATARLQLCYELKQARVFSLAVQSFRDNDQRHARTILNAIKPGDLIIRDLGYFSIGVFGEIAESGGFFQSRLRYGVNSYDPETGQLLDLVSLGRTKKHLDMVVELGGEHRLRVRLVGFRLSEAKAKQRRRKAKKDRHSKANHSADYMQWLGWSFFVTNVPESVWTPVQLYQSYRLRWRIEILFKALKSGLGFATMLHERKLPRLRVEMTIYLMLIYTVLFLLGGYQYWSHRVEGVSLLKYATWLRLYFEKVLEAVDWLGFLASIRRHCLYERRRKRQNFYELMLSS